MGTNYYLRTKNNAFIERYFPEKHSFDGHEYSVHLCKLSAGWRPLFEKSAQFDTFGGLKDFFARVKKEFPCELYISSEYGVDMKWSEFEEIIQHHMAQKRMPHKWTYEVHELFGDNPLLMTELCDESEAELFTPFSHIEYDKTQRAAAEKFDTMVFGTNSKYWEDPCIAVDWTDREFF